MRAAVIRKYGSASKVFHVEDIPDVTPSKDEVKLKVYASSVNPIDYLARSGKLFFLMGFRFPRILGSDFSGVITECGTDVLHLKPGDEVYGFSVGIQEAGAYGENMTCAASRVAIKPISLTTNEAGVLPLAALTAYQALYKEGSMKSGMRVLIAGATGGVGHVAVQIAKDAGCHVTGICNSKNKVLATQLGCDEVLPYDLTDMRKHKQKYDIIFDAAGHLGYLVSRKIMTPKGKYVSTIPSTLSLAVWFLHRFTRSKGDRKVRYVKASSNQPDLDFLTELCDKGALKPYISNVFPLEEIATAHELCETKKTRGKIVITVSTE